LDNGKTESNLGRKAGVVLFMGGDKTMKLVVKRRSDAAEALERPHTLRLHFSARSWHSAPDVASSFCLPRQIDANQVCQVNY